MEKYIDIPRLIEFINIIGAETTKLYNSNKEDIGLQVVYDLLIRIRANLISIGFLKSDDLQISRNLLYRDIFTDLMMAIFFMYIDNDDAKKAMDYFTQSHLKSMEEILKLRCEMANHIFNCEKDSFKDDSLKTFQKINEKYLITKNKDGKWNIPKVSGKLSCMPNFKGRISDIYSFFQTCKELKQYRYLYQYYKILSQSEHYTLFGRGFSLYTHNEEKFVKEYNSMVFIGLDYIRYKIEIKPDDPILKSFKEYYKNKS